MEKQSCEATTLLSHEGVNPPALVTPPREEVKSTGKKVGRRLRRLLTFQATLEKEKGLPPSRWQRRLQFGEEGDATFLNTTGTPVSHRRKWWRREGMGAVEASGPRWSRVEKNSLHPGVWDGGGHQVFCYSCGSWGNLVTMV